MTLIQWLRKKYENWIHRKDTKLDQLKVIIPPRTQEEINLATQISLDTVQRNTEFNISNQID